MIEVKRLEDFIKQAIYTCNVTTTYGLPLLAHNSIYPDSESSSGLKPVGNVDHMEIVIYYWLGPKSVLEPFERRIVWVRNSTKKPLPWTSIAKEFHCSREKARSIYNIALERLIDWLPHQPFYERMVVALEDY